MTTETFQADRTDAATQARIDLAAAHRLAVMDDLHEGTWNHFSLGVPGTDRFLISPMATHWSQVTASELIEVRREDQERIEARRDMLWVAYRIHGPIHWARPDAQAVMHVHSPYIVALSMLEDPTLALAEQNALGLRSRIAYTETYDGFVPQDIRHGEHLAEAIGDKPILILRNHGAVVVGETMGRAYCDLYLLDRAAKSLVLALSTHRPLRLVSEDVAARYTDDEVELAYKDDYFDAMKRVLDEREPNYKE